MHVSKSGGVSTRYIALGQLSSYLDTNLQLAKLLVTDCLCKFIEKSNITLTVTKPFHRASINLIFVISSQLLLMSYITHADLHPVFWLPERGLPILSDVRPQVCFHEKWGLKEFK